jgi:hypothetical protein
MNMGRAAPYDAVAYFHILDREITALLHRFDSDGSDAKKRKNLAMALSVTLIWRARLFDKIVLPSLRQTAMPELLLDRVDQDQQAIWLLAEDLKDTPADHVSFTERQEKLAARYRHRIESDRITLWPAVAALGVDLASIAKRLIAASYEEVDLPPQPRAARNRPADSALGLSSAARGESHGQGRPGRDSTAKSRSPRGRRSVRQGREDQ